MHETAQPQAQRREAPAHEEDGVDGTGIILGFVVGVILYAVIRWVVRGFYSVDQNQRAVKTSFGRAQRLPGTTLDSGIAAAMRPDERQRYAYPQLVVIPAGGPYFKLPWEKVYKVSVATETVSMALDPEYPMMNQNGLVLEAITKDQLNTGLTGQLRYHVSEQNLYAFLFGIKKPLTHVMGYFHAILRERIANFEAPQAQNPDERLQNVTGVSINDLRKNLRDQNDHMDRECATSAARYGISLDASLITSIDPPQDVEAALAAINTAHNHVSSEISLAQAAADQRIVQSHRAVEIATLSAQAEVEPLVSLARQLVPLRAQGPGALQAYVRNVRLSLYSKVKRAVLRVAA